MPDRPAAVWHRAPADADVTFCGLPVGDDIVRLAAQPAGATCPFCVEIEAWNAE